MLLRTAQAEEDAKKEFWKIKRQTAQKEKDMADVKKKALDVEHITACIKRNTRVRDTGSGEPGSRSLFGSGSGSSSLFWPLQWYLSSSNPIQIEPNQYLSFFASLLAWDSFFGDSKPSLRHGPLWSVPMFAHLVLAFALLTDHRHDNPCPRSAH